MNYKGEFKVSTNVKVMPENASRKIDKGGRLTIPSGIRSRFGFELGEKMDYYVIDIDGEQYIAFKRHEEEEELD